MASNNPVIDNKIYAKVENNKVVEYPVLALHITNRSHPKSWYTPCLFGNKPEITPYQYLKEVKTIVDNYVRISYTVHEKTLSQVLSMFKVPSINLLDSTPKDISELTNDDILKVKELASIEVQKILDAFAQTKDYDDIKSVATYVNSSILAFSTEAATAISLRDQCWNNLNTYLIDVQAGTTPVPTKQSEILAVLPTLAW